MQRRNRPDRPRHGADPVGDRGGDAVHHRRAPSAVRGAAPRPGRCTARASASCSSKSRPQGPRALLLVAAGMEPSRVRGAARGVPGRRPGPRRVPRLPRGGLRHAAGPSGRGIPRLRDTLVAVRTHTTSEIVERAQRAQGLTISRRARSTRWSATASATRTRCCGPGATCWRPTGALYGDDGPRAPRSRSRTRSWSKARSSGGSRSRARERPLRLLYVGRMERRKGVENLSRALISDGVRGLGAVAAGRRHGDRAARDVDAHEPRVHGRGRGADHVPGSGPAGRGRASDAATRCGRRAVALGVLAQRRARGVPVRPPGHRHSRRGLDGARPARRQRLAGTGQHGRRPARDARAARPRPAVGARAGPERRPAQRARRARRSRADPARLHELLRTHDPAPPPPRPARPPLVSIVVPYFELDAYVEDTLRSIAAQSTRTSRRSSSMTARCASRIAVLEALSERYRFQLVRSTTRASARRATSAWRMRAGRFVLPLDADDTIEPDFVERCLDALLADPDLAYVGTWSRFVAEDGAVREDGDPGTRRSGTGRRWSRSRTWAAAPAP